MIEHQHRIEVKLYFSSFRNASLSQYQTPIGTIYLFGDDEALRFACFESPPMNLRALRTVKRRAMPFSIVTAMRFLDAYFEKRKAQLPVLDFSRFTEKQKEVYLTLIKVPFGRTITYGQLANTSGVQRAARFVGNCMSKNIYPIFVPCHRVVPSAGGVGNYSAGIKIKKFLMQHEGIVIE
ncbi:MAG: methylated-DNA--[protein]-cysteine S-methyltransferase [Spirochaetes bacterium]|nr:methylated-DNA--[protein]-cysteine S-methyltransferase [Spirochaetota bacterium]